MKSRGGDGVCKQIECRENILGNQVEPRVSVLMSSILALMDCVRAVFVSERKMDVTDFEHFFNDNTIPSEHLERLRLTRTLIHNIYPNIYEQVSYAMPAFYPIEGKKATQVLMMIKANKHWLGIYALPDFNEEYTDFLLKRNLKMGKGSIQIPYDFDAEQLDILLRKIILYNLKRLNFAVPIEIDES